MTQPASNGQQTMPDAGEGADPETVSLSTHPQFLAIIERSRLRQQAEGGISADEMRRRLML